VAGCEVLLVLTKCRSRWLQLRVRREAGDATLSGGTSPCDDRSGRAQRRITAFREVRPVTSIADHDSTKASLAWLFDCVAKSFQKSL